MLTVGDEQLNQPLEIVKEAGVAASPADLKAQFDLLLSIRDKVSSTHKLINQMRDSRAQLKGWRERLAGLESAEPASSKRQSRWRSRCWKSRRS